MTCAEKLVAHYGGRHETADALDINPETVRLWLRDGIPLAKALWVEGVSKRIVTAEQILREAREKAAA